MPFWKVWAGKEKNEETAATEREDHKTADEAAVQTSIQEHGTKVQVDPRDALRRLYLTYVLRDEPDKARACLLEAASRDTGCARSVDGDLSKVVHCIYKDLRALSNYSKTLDASHMGPVSTSRPRTNSVRQFLVPVSRDSSSDSGFDLGNIRVSPAQQEARLLSPYNSTELSSPVSGHPGAHQVPSNYPPPFEFEAYQCDLCDSQIQRTAAFEFHMRNVHALVFGQKSRTTFALTCADESDGTWTAKLRCRNGRDTLIVGELVPRTPAGPVRMLNRATSRDFSLDDLERRGTCAISSTSDEVGIPPGKKNRTIIGANLCSPTADIISPASKKRDKTQLSPAESTFGDGKRYKPNSPTLSSPRSACLPGTPVSMSDGLRAQLARRRSQEARLKVC